MIRFYFHQTPNPMKVALLLEELGAAYEPVALDTFKGDQHSGAFLKINPNGKAPAIEDDGVRVFDSTAILLYLAEKHGAFLGDPADRGELLSWLFWVASGLGPFSGQWVHFQTAGAENGGDYAKRRYKFEAHRHYRVLDDHLAGRDFIVGDGYTIADMAAWGWVDRNVRVLGEGGLGAYPNLKRWYDAVSARPAVAKARELPQRLTFKTDFDDETRRALFPSNFA
ncbi:glutathione S-transferase N-terminal domain-containing protein [Acuticoccus sp. MNP-M23]|uniref:glutathione S-transferase family protein n=1 Tax=Acuticoccus sp. MNP-M23 TaxID=3072793 RepID=UPI002815E5AC|nr:glutathione S-transferase N-terminal domain-containing protein [Acuticoccus sp. MNP-M23]WMS43659.1 glutathione S-transferase N-terminal domain-containing protein [Acuticoccus sp. MNP-M23]